MPHLFGSTRIYENNVYVGTVEKKVGRCAFVEYLIWFFFVDYIFYNVMKFAVGTLAAVVVGSTLLSMVCWYITGVNPAKAVEWWFFEFALVGYLTLVVVGVFAVLAAFFTLVDHIIISRSGAEPNILIEYLKGAYHKVCTEVEFYE